MLLLATCHTNTINNQSSSEQVWPVTTLGTVPVSNITDTKQDKCASPHTDTALTPQYQQSLPDLHCTPLSSPTFKQYSNENMMDVQVPRPPSEGLLFLSVRHLTVPMAWQ